MVDCDAPPDRQQYLLGPLQSARRGPSFGAERQPCGLSLHVCTPQQEKTSLPQLRLSDWCHRGWIPPRASQRRDAIRLRVGKNLVQKRGAICSVCVQLLDAVRPHRRPEPRWSKLLATL